LEGTHLWPERHYLQNLLYRKHVDFLLKPGDSIGCDFAGDVAAIGSNAKDKGLSIGDAVAGFIRGGYVVSDNGAFQGMTMVLHDG